MVIQKQVSLAQGWDLECIWLNQGDQREREGAADGRTDTEWC